MRNNTNNWEMQSAHRFNNNNKKNTLQIQGGPNLLNQILKWENNTHLQITS